MGMLEKRQYIRCITKYMTAYKAKKRFVRFDLEKYQKIYFHEVFTYTEDEFEKEFLSNVCAGT